MAVPNSQGGEDEHRARASSGSTWRSSTLDHRAPLAPAASTNGLWRTRSTSERMTRAQAAMLASPTARATLYVPKPSTVISARESSSAGIARITSTSRISASSTQPRANPATSPISDADDEADDDGEERRLHRQRGAVHDAGVQVAAELVGAEQVRPRRRLQAGRALDGQRVART